MKNYRELSDKEIATLVVYGCSAENWKNVKVAENFTPNFVSNVHFSGNIVLGAFEKTYELPGGFKKHSGLFNCCLHNCSIGDNVYIDKVNNYIANYDIGNDTYIENTDLILVDRETAFGNGTIVTVMNEGGGREVPIFNNLSASLAYILTLYKYRPALIESIKKMIHAYVLEQKSYRGRIGSNVEIINCGTIKNVCIGDNATIRGTTKLENGSVNSNEKSPTTIGAGVQCEDFIISSGASVIEASLVSKCFIGQGCILAKQYSAIDSLFFANSQGMHGEATAVFAGPYTISHHKSTLLIAGMFSFFNAGSGTNQSNHNYKLGPLHQGLAERGVKTGSDSYLLFPARIGAFTLVAGRHTKHSDISNLPFSYLIERDGESYIMPAANLVSVGTVRDVRKWEVRDMRKDNNKLDIINFNLFTPYIIQKVIKGIEILEKLKQGKENTEVYAYQGCKINRLSLTKGIELYKSALYIFFGERLLDKLSNENYKNIDVIKTALTPKTNEGIGEWVDLSGLIAPKSEVEKLLSEIEQEDISLNQIQEKFNFIHSQYRVYEWAWVINKLPIYCDKQLEKLTIEDIVTLIEHYKESVLKLNKLVREDAQTEFGAKFKVSYGIDGSEEEKELDFKAVRNDFESHPFVVEITKEAESQISFADDVLKKLKKIR